MPPLPVVVAYVLCVGIWGTTFFAVRVCIGPGGYPTVLSGGLRFVIAATILGAILALGFGRPGPKGARTWKYLVVAGLLNSGAYALVYKGEEEIPGALAAVVYGLLPLVTAFIGALTGLDRPRRAQVVGALLGLAGIVIISWDRLDVAPKQALAVLMVFGSVVLCASYNFVLKKHASGVNPLATNFAFASVTALCMVSAGLALEREAPPWPPPTAPTIALLYLAIVGSVVAFGCYFYLLKRVRLMTLSTLVFLEPIIALVVDAFWEAQAIGGRTWIGVGVVMAGVLANLLGGPRRVGPVAAAAPPTSPETG